MDTLTLQLRGHLMLAIPVVEALADQLPEDDVPRACAHAGVMEARARLRLDPGHSLPRRVAHAQRLARSVNALCDHCENLTTERPEVLDERQAALLQWWNHCITCATCSTTTETGGVTPTCRAWPQASSMRRTAGTIPRGPPLLGGGSS
ncbi:DUF6415 family natural product biosynthesis protein [Streptomyces sp. NPDC003362]